MENLIAFFLVLPSLFLLLFLVVKDKENSTQTHLELPFVSILIAVRNEEKNLPKLFKSLSNLKYPSHLIQMIFGNDMSDDSSAELIAAFCAEHKNAQMVEIQPTEVQIAKANVLMQIAHFAKGEYLYFVDADMRPNDAILHAFLSTFRQETAGITGVSIPEGVSLWARMQRIDWVFALSMISKAEGMNVDTSAMGNNMMIKTLDYKAVGGYENLAKSVVEDFTLYKAIRKKNREFPIFFNKKLISYTKPILGISRLLQQRKRWATGAIQLNWFLKLVLGFQGVYYPLFIFGLFCFSKLFLALMILKISVQSIFVYKQFKKLDLKTSFLDLVFYEIYNSVFTCVLFMFYILPLKFDWKKRSYGNH